MSLPVVNISRRWDHTVSVLQCLILLNTVFSRSICITAHIRIYSFYGWVIFHSVCVCIIYICHILFIRILGLLSPFGFTWIILLLILAYKYLYESLISVLLNIYLGVIIAGSHGSCRFHLLRNCRTVGPSICTVVRSRQQYDPSMLTGPYFLVYCASRPSRREVMSRCDFDFQWLMMCNIFSCAFVCVLWRKWHPFWPSDTLLVLLHSSAMSLYSANFFWSYLESEVKRKQ